MKHQSSAQEQFEGALITLLLDQVIQRQGESLLAEAERLNADPAANVPDALDKKCRTLIRRGLRRQKKQQAGSRSLWKTTLLVAITASLLAAAAFASFDELRVGVLNLMLTVTDTYTGLGIEATFPENVPQAKTDLSYYTLPDIPDGFTPVEIDRRDSQQVFLYVNNKGEKLFISVSFYSSGGNYTLDTENADVVLDVLVSGYRGLYVEKDDVTQVAWLDTDRSVILHVLATGEVGQQVMAMAKQMHYQPAGNTDLMNYALPAIPEDYQSILTSETERARSFFYENASQDMIVISIYQGSSGTIHAIDTEDADCVLDIVINGYAGLYVEKGASTQIAWLDTDHSVFLDLWAGALPREQVLSMAQELVYKSS